jgi:hypothetical protein
LDQTIVVSTIAWKDQTLASPHGEEEQHKTATKTKTKTRGSIAFMGIFVSLATTSKIVSFVDAFYHATRRRRRRNAALDASWNIDTLGSKSITSTGTLG